MRRSFRTRGSALGKPRVFLGLRWRVHFRAKAIRQEVHEPGNFKNHHSKRRREWASLFTSAKQHDRRRRPLPIGVKEGKAAGWARNGRPERGCDDRRRDSPATALRTPEHQRASGGAMSAAGSLRPQTAYRSGREPDSLGVWHLRTTDRLTMPTTEKSLEEELQRHCKGLRH